MRNLQTPLQKRLWTTIPHEDYDTNKYQVLQVHFFSIVNIWHDIEIVYRQILALFIVLIR